MYYFEKSNIAIYKYFSILKSQILLCNTFQ
jgi:hypothetical protein